MEDLNPFSSDGNLSSSSKKKSYSGRGKRTQFGDVFAPKVDPNSNEGIKNTSPPHSGKTPSDTPTNTNIRALHEYIKETPKKKTSRNRTVMKLYIGGFIVTAIVALVFIVAVWYIHSAMRKKLLVKKAKQRAEYVQKKYDQMIEEMKKQDSKAPLEATEPEKVEQQPDVMDEQKYLEEKIKIYVQLYYIYISDDDKDPKVVKEKLYPFKIRRNTLVKKLKLAIKKVLKIPIKKQTLLFKNGILEGEFEDYTIDDLEIVDGSVLDLEVERKVKRKKTRQDVVQPEEVVQSEEDVAQQKEDVQSEEEVAQPEEVTQPEDVAQPEEDVAQQKEDVAQPEEEIAQSEEIAQPEEPKTDDVDETSKIDIESDDTPADLQDILDFQNREMNKVEEDLTEMEQKMNNVVQTYDSLLTEQEQLDLELGEEVKDMDESDLLDEEPSKDVVSEPEFLKPQDKVQVSVDLEKFEVDSLIDIE